MIGVAPPLHAPRSAASWTPPSSASPRRTSSASSSAAWSGRASACAARWPTAPCPRRASIRSPCLGRPAARGARRSSGGCGRPARRAATCGRRPSRRPSSRGRRAGVGVPQSNVIPAVAETDARRPADPGHRRRRHPRRARGDLPRARDGRASPGSRWSGSRSTPSGWPPGSTAPRPLVRGDGPRGAGRRPAGPPRYGGVPGSTDGTILRMELGIPIVTCGPGRPADPPPGRRVRRGRRSRRGGEDLRRIGSELPRSRVTRAGNPRLRALEAFPVEQEGQRCVALRDPAGFTDQIAVLPPPLLDLVSLFDGEHSIEEIRRDPAAPHGEAPTARADRRRSSSDSTSTGSSTARASRQRRRALEDAFRRSPVRPAATRAAPMRATRRRCAAQIDGFFAAADGPGERPIGRARPAAASAIQPLGLDRAPHRFPPRRARPTRGRTASCSSARTPTSS